MSTALLERSCILTMIYKKRRVRKKQFSILGSFVYITIS